MAIRQGFRVSEIGGKGLRVTFRLHRYLLPSGSLRVLKKEQGAATRPVILCDMLLIVSVRGVLRDGYKPETMHLDRNTRRCSRNEKTGNR